MSIGIAATRLAALLILLLAAAPAVAQTSSPLSRKASDAGELISAAQARGHVRVIVQFASPVAPGALRADSASIANVRRRVAALQDAIIATHFGSAASPTAGRGFARGIKRFGLTPGFAVNVTQPELEALAADPRVVHIQYDRPVPPTLIQSVPLVGMTNSYVAGATGAGYAVAILDTGVQANHEFLSGKVVAEACFSNAGGFGGAVSLCPGGSFSQTGAGSANPNTAACISGSRNICLHGTHVAGIAAAENTSQSAGEPTNGVAKNADILAIQIFTRFNDAFICNGAAPCVLAYTSDQIDALDYVLANTDLGGGITVASVNMSLGGGSNSSTCDGDTRKVPIDGLRALNVLTAIASGNSGSTSAISNPGCISTAITVGSTDKSNTISGFSNMSSVVDLLAPGGFGGGSCALGANNGDILGPVAVASGATDSYDCLAGTSMATPHVAGAIAAIRSACPAASAAAIESALETSGLLVADTRPGGTQTKPRIRVDLALQELGCVPASTLEVFPYTDMVSAGNRGGPFSPSSFQYQVQSSSGTADFSVTNLPSWLTAAPASGTATTTQSAVALTLNANANSMAAGVYGRTEITFANTGGGIGTQTRSVTLTVNATIGVTASPSNGGTVSGGGTFAGGSRTVTAFANSGYTFVNWTEGGGVVSTSASYTFTLTGNRSLVAHFSASNFTISLGVSPSGTGTVAGGGTFAASSSRTVSATPGTGYRFVNWTEGGSQVSTSASYAFTLTRSRTLIAHFARLTFRVRVGASPSNGGAAAGGGTFAFGTARTVVATPSRGFRFLSWAEGRAQVSAASRFRFTVTRNRTLLARFGRAHVSVNDLVADLGEAGLFQFLDNRAWRRVHAASPSAIATGDLNGNGKDEILAALPSGLWARYDSGRWVRLDARRPTQLVTGDLDNSGRDDIVIGLGSAGVFARLNDAGGFVRLRVGAARLLATGDLDGNRKDEVLAVFANGLWVRSDTGAWSRLHAGLPAHLATGDLDNNGKEEVFVSFTRTGTFVRRNNAGGFARLDARTAEALAVGDFNGNGKDELLAVFPNGLSLRRETGQWTILDARMPLNILAVDLDGNGKDDIVAGFSGVGLLARYNNAAAWVSLRPSVSEGLAGGGFN